MKKVVKLSVVLFVCLMVTSVSAQDLSFGVKAGVNFSNMVSDDEESGDIKIGPVAGVTVDYGINEYLFIFTGLDLSYKGFKGTNYNTSVTMNPIYLQVPIHVGTKLSISEKAKIVFEAGPYVAFGIAGKTTVERSGISVSEDIFGDKGGLKRFDFGFGAGVGLEFNKLKFSLGYDYGFANVYDSDEKIYNRILFLTVGYRF